MVDLETIWIALLAIAAPVAGVVGFALQVRNVRKLKLENLKLALEIEALEENLRRANAKIVIPTTEEVERISRRGPAMMSRRGQRDAWPTLKARFSLGELGILVAVAAVLLYLAYDLYRLANWLVSWVSTAGPR